MGFAFQQAHSQSYTPIDGVDLNTYASITAIRSAQPANPDSLVLVSTTGFNAYDTVMVYCVKGAIIGTGDPAYLPGDDIYPAGEDGRDPRNAGRYGFYLISEVKGDTVILNAGLSGFIGPSLAEGEVAQLIKARSFRYANVTAAGLSAPPWDPLTGTGGVLTLFVHGVLRLDGDIDVSGDGFKGALGSSDAIYSNGCPADTMDYYENFYLDGELWAGLKGEGITDTRFLYNRGKASSINGGGGGNGLHAGGGGGSNHGKGVRGGEESSSCSPGLNVSGGGGGYALSTGYYVNGDPVGRGYRIFLGGGGGSGTRTTGTSTTDGGNGGGIVVIIADTIEGNGHWIRADGGDVSGEAVNGAGAGGGGGGCIILDVAGYQSTLNLSAVGGDGGNSSSTGTDTLGMGGAGGGGVYWLAGDTHPGVVPDFSQGSNGAFLSPVPYSPLLAPSRPDDEFNLVAPLKGFLFNPVPSEFRVCSDQDPEAIVTSDPKGGTAPYTYQWIDSTALSGDWNDIVGATDRDYDPPLLSDTTYYKRIMTDANSLVDTSFLISVYVHPEITGNTIAANDTVCSGNAPELFVSGGTIGGGPTNGTYNYLWQQMPDDSSTYSDLGSKTMEPTYQEVALTISTDYRRIAYAGVCMDTSNVERVRVLESIMGNDITPYDTICINTAPDLIDGPAPSNGDQDDIRYQWLTSTDPGLMGSVIAGATSIDYQSPALSATTYIRRIVLSGNDDACKDTSAFVEILNVVDITGNTITADQTLCQQDQAAPLTGSSPGGGFGGYTYTWISSTDQSNWVPATGNNGVETGYEPGVMNGDTTWYRRVVGSGGLELVCKDTSITTVVIEVLPSITNNVLTPVDDLLCQLDNPEAINGSLPGGGATVGGNDLTRKYRWEVAQLEGIPGSGDWTHPSGAIDQNYTDPDPLSTDDDRWYRRIVISGSGDECSDTSNLVHLVVHSGITANEIDASQAICFNDSRALRNITMTGGEDTITPVYTWRRWLEGQSSVDAVDLPGSNFQEFEDAPYTHPATLIYNYDRVVEIGACRDTSNEMTVTVMQLPGGELTDADFQACEQTTFLNLDLNMDALTMGHYMTPWEVHLKNGVHTDIGPGSVDMDLDTMGIILSTGEADHVSYTYEIESIRYYPEGDDYYCISSATELPLSPVAIDVSRKPDPQILVDGESLQSFELCGDTATLVLNPDNGTLSSWSVPTGSVSITAGSGQDVYHVTIPDNPDDYGQYRIYVMSEAGDCSGLDSIDLHFFEQPEPAYAGEPIMRFVTREVQLEAQPATAGTGTWRRTGGEGTIEDENDPNTFVYYLGENQENTFEWTVTNGVCSTSQDVAIVHQNEVKSYNGFSPNGDMSNEYFIMQGLVYADKFEAIFLNALGNEVRTINQDNYSELEQYIDESLIADGLRDDEMVIWDGRANNGNMVPDGTYYFVVTLTMYVRNFETEEVIEEYSDDVTGYVVVAKD